MVRPLPLMGLLLALALPPAGVRADAPATPAKFDAPPGAHVTSEGWFAPAAHVKRPTLPAKIERAFIIPIREEISQKTLDALERKFERCRKSAAQLIIFDMDTFGGELKAALNIARLIKVDLADVYTVCYVRTRAISAGALIALACNEIIMTPVGSFGDCAPISPGAKIEGVEREKLETEVRREFRESADRNGYSDAIAQGMVTADLEVHLARNPATDELRYVIVDDRPTDAQGKRPAATTAPATMPPGFETVRVIKPMNRLLTLKTSEAVEYRFVRTVLEPSVTDPYGVVARQYALSAAPVVLQDTWSETLVEFLTSGTVTGILLFLGIFLAYMELNAPGHFVPGLLAVICFAIVFGSRFLVGMSDWWQIALFVVGLAMIVIELLTFHTAGILLVVGIGCCVTGLLAIMVPHMPGTLPIPRTNMDWAIFKSGARALGLGFIGAVVAAMLFARYLPKLPVAGKLVLASPIIPSQPPVSEHAPLVGVNVGDLGVAESLCRPVGKARFGDRLVSATSTGEIIQPGEPVRVLKRDENRVVIERA